MRKLSLILILCMLVVCLASCDGLNFNSQSSADTNNGAVETSDTTNAAGNTSDPADQDGVTTEKPNETKEPQVPQDKWTERY